MGSAFGLVFGELAPRASRAPRSRTRRGPLVFNGGVFRDGYMWQLKKLRSSV